MRLLFIALLALNLFYFGLQLRDDLDREAARPPAGAALPAATPGLRVLHEAPAAAPAPPPTSAAALQADELASALVLAPALQLLPFAVSLPILQPGSFVRQGRCRRYGPLRAREQQQTLLASMVRKGLSVRAHSSLQPRVRLYMVHIRMPDREAARKRVQQLRAQGLEDIRLIEGTDAWRDISLGVFSSRRIAERRLRNLGGAGVQARIAPYGRGKVQTQYWLDVMMEAPLGAPAQDLDSLADLLADEAADEAPAHEPLDCREFVP